MAASVSSDDEFLCSICLDLFTDPVTTPCGHNFCERCLCQHWNISALCRCPLCKELFHTRPDLKVNKLLSEVVSRLKLETRRRSEVSKLGEVSCDFCTGPKLKALKSCLVCLSSFCDMHLQPHLNVPGLKSHQLMEPVENIQDRMCPQHQKPLELFCRSDHSCVCTMCALLEHKTHDYVTLREESEQRKVSLQQKQEESQQMVEQRRQKIQELQRSLQQSERAADTEKTMGLQAFNALIETVQRNRERFMLELQKKLKQNKTHTEVLVQQLRQEICELQQKITEAEQLQRSEDHLHFLQHCPALPPTGLKDCSCITLELQMFEGTAAGALAKLEKNLKDTLGEEIKKVSSGEFKSAQNFAMNLTLDPESANTYLSVSDNLKEVHHTNERKFSDGPQRFSWYTIITKQSISSGRCYFEVQVKDKTQWYLGVVKQSVNRQKAPNSENGYWCLYMKHRDEYYACADPLVSLSLKCAPQKVGVFVDYSKGLISFYNADTEELIYSFTNCCFTETLFPFLNPCSNNEGVNSAPLILSTVKK